MIARACIWSLMFAYLLLVSTASVAQSYDLKTEKEKLTKIEAAIQAADDTRFMAECDALLDIHRINALAWFLCGKHLLFVKETDPKTARAHVKLAYHRLHVAAEQFLRTGRQVYYAFDAEQYLGLAAMLMGDLDRAQTHFKTVVDRDSRIPAAWYNLGIIFELKGLQEESMRAFDRHLRLKTGGDATDF
jgi:tetratricopeptide (TPR) repeat protein